MSIIKKIYTLIRVLNKHYPSDWVGYEFVNKYYNSSKTSPVKKGVIFMCDGKKYHGGLTDRIQGALSTYSIAKKHNLPFYINWVEPFFLTDYLIPADKVDWRIDSSDIIYDKRHSFPAIMSLKPSDCRKENRLNEFIFKYWFHKSTNQTHVYTNLNFAINDFPQLYRELFRPSKKLVESVNDHLNKLGLKYWSFSFRFNQLLGDFKDTVGEPLSDEGKENLIVKNLNELRKLLSMMPVGYKAFVACDSMTFLERVKSLDSRIYTIPGKIVHIDQKSTNFEEEDIWLKTFTDQHIIMSAEKVFLLRTDGMYNSGFPKFAALIGDKEFINHIF